MEKTKISYGPIFGVFLPGGAVGALAGILLAPKSDRELRSELERTRKCLDLNRVEG